MDARRFHAAASRRMLALTLAALAPAAAQAQTMGDKWEWELILYGWFPSVGGSTSFPAPAPSPSIDISSNDVIDALKMAFMGTAAGRVGKWGFLTDLFYADLGGSKSGTRDFSIDHLPIPVGVTANLNLDVKTTIWTLAGTYNLAAKPEGTSDLVFGARLLDMDQTLDYSFVGGAPVPAPTASGRASRLDFDFSRSGTSTASLSNWDAIVGLRGRINLGESKRWYLPYYLDAGAGESKFTWQGIIGIGYQFDWGSIGASWRYLDYDFKSGSTITSFNLNGAAVGVTFRF